MTASRLLCLLVLPMLGLAVMPARSQDDTSLEELRAEAELKRLTARVGGPSSDLPKLRAELAALRARRSGTTSAIKAAVLLSQLPSPLDRLDAKTIPPLERFDWQPKELVGVLGEHRGRHGSAVSCVAVSPDGTMIASGGTHLVRIWRPKDMRLIGTMGHGYGITSITFSPNSKMIAAAGSGGAVAVWEVSKSAAPKHRFTFSAGTSAAYSLSFHPNSKVLAVACYDNAIRLYDVSGKAHKSILEITPHKAAVMAVAFSPDGKTLASGSSDKTARLWAFDGTELKERSLLNHPAGVTALAFTRTGKSLATGCADGSLRLWGMPPGAKPRSVHLGTKSSVTSLCFSSSGATLATTSGGVAPQLWNVNNWKDRGGIEGHTRACTGVVYSPDMKLLITGGSDWMCRTWDLTKSKTPERFVPWSHLSAVYSTAFAPDTTTLVSGSEDNIVRFWNIDQPQPRTTSFLKPKLGHVYAVAYSPDGKLFAAAGATTEIWQWETAMRRTRAKCTGLPSHIMGLAYSGDGKHLIAGSHMEVIAFHAATGEVWRRFPPHETRLNCMAVSPDGRHVASGSGTYLYDKLGRVVYKDGKPVYTDCVLRLWDLERGAEATTIKDAKTPFYSTAFSADGKLLFGGNYDPNLRRWEVKQRTVKEVAPWKGTAGHVHSLLVTPDNKTVITRGLDGLVVTWDMATGKRLQAWGFQEQVMSLAVSGDSRYLSVPLVTGVVYVLRLAPSPKQAPPKGGK
jgi:WD40 repeat protein